MNMQFLLIKAAIVNKFIFRVIAKMNVKGLDRNHSLTIPHKDIAN